MRKILSTLAATAFLSTAVPAIAHDEMPVSGQVTAVTPTSIQLRTKDGKVVKLGVDSNTRVKQGDKRLTAKDVKVGQSVKALGFGDNVNALVAIDVTIVPPAHAKGH